MRVRFRCARRRVRVCRRIGRRDFGGAHQRVEGLLECLRPGRRPLLGEGWRGGKNGAGKQKHGQTPCRAGRCCPVISCLFLCHDCGLLFAIS